MPPNMNIDNKREIRANLENSIKRSEKNVFSQNSPDTYDVVKGDTGNYIEQEAALIKINQVKESNKVLHAFEVNTLQKINEANQINHRLIDLLVQANSSQTQLDPTYFKLEITGMVDQLTNILNSRDSATKEVMLAGVNSDSDAVTNLKNFLQTTTGNFTTPDFTYYLGGKKGSATQIDDNFFINKFAVTAQDDAFEKTIRALGLCLKANPNNLATSPELKQALDLSNNAQNHDYARVQSVVGLSIKTVSQSTESNSLKEIEITNQINAEHYESFFDSFQKIQMDKVYLELSRHFAMQDLVDLREDIQAYS